MEGQLIHYSGEYFYSVAALFSCCAYLLRSMLWLRALLVCAALVYIIAGIRLGVASMIGWNTAYLLINLFHIGLLLFDRVAITLPADTRRVYQRYFSSLSSREFKNLIPEDQFCTFQDENIVDESMVPQKLFIVLRGKVKIVRGNEVIATLGAGAFIGEMSFLSKEPASASACAENFVQCAYWTHDDLEKMQRKNIGLYNRFISIVGRDLVRKLRHKNEQLLDSVTKLDYVI